MNRLLILLLGVSLGAAGVAALLVRGYLPYVHRDHAVTTAAPTSVATGGAPAIPAADDYAPSTLLLRPTPAASAVADSAVAVVAPAAAPLASGPAASLEPLPLVPSGPAIAPLGLLVPVAGVQPKQLVDTYTQSRGEGRSHDAIDIMAARGTPVLAVADGRVVKLFTSVRGGLTLYQFDSGETLCYYYAHLDGYAPGVVEGKQLKRGDLVGFVGSTGDASPDAPHLHFAIDVLGPEKNWWQGTAINPYPLLSGK